MKRNSPWNLIWSAALAILAAQSLAQAQLSGLHQKVALSSETDPLGKVYGNISGCVLGNDGLTTFYHVPGILFNPPRLYQGTVKKVDRGFGGSISAFAVNVLGEIAFVADFNGGTSLFLASTTGYKNIALQGDGAPGGGVFKALPSDYCLNDSSKVAFRAFTDGGPGQGIYLYTGSGIVSLALGSTAAPGGGVFSSFGSRVVVNNPGQIAFSATTSGGGSGGIYLVTATTPTVTKVLITPIRPADFMLNDAGQIAFTTGGAVHLATTAGDTVIVNNGDNAPGGGTFTSFDAVRLNQSGQVVFRANTSTGSGLYLWSPNGLTSVVLNDTPAPGGSNFTSLGVPLLNNSGQVVFRASTAGGNLICFVDGTNLFKVVSAGESLLGVPITDVDLGDEYIQINDLGQVAYFADFSNGVRGLFIFTPGPHWLVGGNGTWDTAANWTDGTKPLATDNAAIDPATAATVVGPAAATTVRSLVVGGGAGDVTLQLQPGVTLTTTTGMALAPNATLSGTGTIGGNLTLFAGAHVELGLGGSVRGADYDFVKVTGKATFIGTLDVTVKNGLTLHGRDSFDLFDWGSRSGQFVTVNLPTLAPKLSWDTSKLYTTGTITVSMATFFAANAGKYSGLVSANPAAFASSGALALKLDQGGSFTGTLKMGGKSIPVRGALDDAGHFSGALGTTGFTLTLDLQGPADQFTASITQNAMPFSTATLDRVQTGFTKDNPVAMAGSYTVELPADPNHPEDAYPKGSGYGSLVVAPTGTVKLTGVLGDLTTATPAGILSKNNEFAVFFPLYGGKGFLSGVLTLKDAAQANHVTGTLHWFKPANSSKSYPATIDGDITVVGSHYVVPATPPTPPQVLPIGAAMFVITAGNVTATPTKNPTIAAGNVVTLASGEKFSLKIATKTGLFSGSFLDADLKARAFKGAYLQKQKSGPGAFKGENRTGKIELQPQ